MSDGSGGSEPARRVLVAGGINFDVIAPISRMPSAHEKLRGDGYFTSTGGAAANTARGIARTSHSVEMVSCVGNDIFGDMCLETLSVHGVGIERVRRVAEKTAISIIFVGRNDKRVLTFSGPKPDEALDSLTAETLQTFDLLHLSVHPSPSAISLIERARSAKCQVSIEWNGRDMRTLARNSTLNFMNADELRTISRRDADTPTQTADLLKDLHGDVIITMGTDGALWAGQDGEQVFEPVRRLVDPLDPTGGGDAFDAACISAYLSGKTKPECLRSGLAAARETISNVGA